MLKKMNTILVGIFAIAVIIKKVNDKKIDREIDEFDRSMRETKRHMVEQYNYYEKEACQRKEVTKCCQIK